MHPSNLHEMVQSSDSYEPAQATCAIEPLLNPSTTNKAATRMTSWKYRGISMCLIYWLTLSTALWYPGKEKNSIEELRSLAQMSAEGTKDPIR
jgi:hypothetical protein